MIRHFFKSTLVALLLLVHLPGSAEDIDLFVGATPSTADVPNVLIILDNTANWSSAFTNEMAALQSVFNGLTLNRFKVGLMMFSETGGGNSGNAGAYVRAAMRLMDSTNRPKYATLINSLNSNNDKSNGGAVGKSMEEAYLYLSGRVVYAGNNKDKTDYTGNTSGTAASNAVYALPGNALSSKAGTTYITPVTATSCSKNYIIYISNGAAQDNSSDTTQATTALAAAGGSTTTIPLNPSGSQDNIADEWARFLKVSSLGVTVYTVDINKVTTGQGPGFSALLKSAAAQSSGKYFDVASGGTQIQDALNNIFSEIQSVNSVFASVSLPVSVNTQGTFLNQVYIGMFRPDPDANPRWAGNLKQYKLGVTNGSLQLQDADGASAINNQTGFITECARSYWTPSAVDTEWTFRPQGDCLTVANSRASNYPDGNIVDKGAQAYKLRGSSTRTVNTCSSIMATCTTLTTFDNTNVTQTMLGAASTTERDALINWAIGQDVDDENINGITTAERRLSAHGDVVHSRPVAINFGTNASPNVVAFYGANDGMLRAVNGNRTSSIGSIPAGGELWAFMPPEFYSSIKRLRDNTTRISFPNNTSGSPTPLPKSYGMDGPITAFQGTVGGVSKSFVYATMRRGGRAIYAFDVTNSATTPSSPTLKWKIGCPNAANDTGCTTGLSGIGQTWSSLKSFTAQGYGSGSSTMLITGGGYDSCDDYDALTSGGANQNCTSTSKGHFVYVLDADTGAIVKSFDTGGTRGVIADVTLVRDSTGQVIYGYTADLGGNVYRIAFGSGAPASWTMTKIASLGCDTTTACTANRKFMFAPSVVTVNGNYVIMLGSGDREKPLTYYSSTTAVTNYFFMFTDKPTTATSTWPGSADCGSEIICKNSLLGITGTLTPTAADLVSKKGWYLGLTSTEQVVTSAVTIFGVVTFSTQQPAVPVTGSCASNLGTARVYNVAYDNAASSNGTADRFFHLVGDGLPPSPVAGRVTLDNGSTVPFCIGCSKDSPLQSSTPTDPGVLGQPKRRLYWYIQK
jgi:type IV pilus assembly protein PilY1